MLSLVPLVEGEEEKACFIRLAPSLRRLWMQKASYSSSTWNKAPAVFNTLYMQLNMLKCSHSYIYVCLDIHIGVGDVSALMKESFWSLKASTLSKHPWAGCTKTSKTAELFCVHISGIHSWIQDSVAAAVNHKHEEVGTKRLLKLLEPHRRVQMWGAGAVAVWP